MSGSTSDSTSGVVSLETVWKWRAKRKYVEAVKAVLEEAKAKGVQFVLGETARAEIYGKEPPALAIIGASLHDDYLKVSVANIQDMVFQMSACISVYSPTSTPDNDPDWESGIQVETVPANGEASFDFLIQSGFATGAGIIFEARVGRTTKTEALWIYHEEGWTLSADQA